MIEYLVGDATDPGTTGARIIAHVVNDIGRWGRGFVLSVTKRYPTAEAAYREWNKGERDQHIPFNLGEVQFVHVAPNIVVANMIAQRGVDTILDMPPIRYDALEICLIRLRSFAQRYDASVHMPRIGCGLAGGEWSKVEKLVSHTLADVKTLVYDFDTQDKRTIPWSK